ncbi:MAG: tyrosine-type recombinase/integrase [Deltaproteobacteria bacterium]|nr:tyrosine-type recombinase/integrase [Deltaproteobacteria bacterium]
MESLIYDYERRLRCALKTLERADISEANRKVILGFNQESLSLGLSKARIVKYTYYLLKMAEWLGKDFESATVEDIKSLVRKIDESEYVAYSKSEHKMVLRKLYKWLRQTEDFPPEVAWIRPHQKKASRIKMPEELLTEGDIRSMIQASQKERDRALVATLYESGCRIGELIPMRIRHVSFDRYGATIVVDGKTGPRRVRLISSVPYLKEWLNKHPDPGNPESFVWIKGNGELMGYTRVSELLKHLARKAGIKKHVYPHLFRHSRATYLANHLTEAQMKEYFGWVQESDMAGVYVHLSGRDVDDALLKVYGIHKPDTRKESGLKPRICERCEAQNPYTNLFCSRCGNSLDEAARISIVKKEMDRKQADSALDVLIQDREFREMLIRKLQGLALEKPPHP